MKISIEVVLVYLFCAFVYSISIFCYGFFPISFSPTTKSKPSDLPKGIDNVKFEPYLYKPRTSRAVLMIIDALRLDFISRKENLKFLNELLSNATACSYQLKVHPPTVTMPRIKAMTSGTIPSFLDVVFNLGSPEMKLDTFLHQMQENNQKIIFYGDNTWTNMFPDTFERSGDNLDSLFVNDFYEGDINVTRNMKSELNILDWKLMIMHFLGLDHIGHVEGPFSSKVPPKLEEMDEVIKEIYLTMEKWNKKFRLPSMFFITGDHGMRDSGGHGGSSSHETHVPLIVIGNNCTSSSEMYQQIDLAPTFSVLMGVPIPNSSIGSIIPEILHDLPNKDKLFVSYYNTKRLIDKAMPFYREGLLKKEFYIQFKEAELLHKMYIDYEADPSILKKSLMKYAAVSKELSKTLVKHYVRYDLFSILIGLVLSSATAVLSILIFTSRIQEEVEVPVKLSTWVIISTAGLLLKYFMQNVNAFESNLLTTNFSAHVLLLITFTCSYFHCSIFSAIYETIKPKITNNAFYIFFTFCTLFHGLSLSSSSYIEEEHQTWYYFTNTLFLFVFYAEFKKITAAPKRLKSSSRNFAYLQSLAISSSLFFVGHIILRRLNQTGDKWLHLPDIGDWISRDENKFWMSLLLFLSLCILIFEILPFSGMLTNILSLTACILIYYYRTVTEIVLLFRVHPYKSNTCLFIFWINIFEIFCINYIPKLYKWVVLNKSSSKDMSECVGAFITIYSLISSLLHKPHNVILNASLIATSHFLNKSIDNTVDKKDTQIKLIAKVLSHIWLGKMFYFYQGNSNNLASIDLNAGYVGLSSFNFTLVGLFLTMNTYNGQILSFLLLVHHLIGVSMDKKNHRDKSILVSSINLLSITTIFPFAFYIIIVTILRDHIFVWTVFSPKIFYDFYSMCLTFVKMWFLYFVFK